MKTEITNTTSLSRFVTVKFKLFFTLFLFVSAALLSACGQTQGNDTGSATTSTNEPAEEETAAASADEGKGVGPVSHVELTTGIDQTLATQGKTLFEAKCSACHNADENKKVGPGLKGVTERRKPEWIMNMVLNPDRMVQEDPTAKELLAQYMAPMANLNLTQDEARTVLEYFRQNDRAN